MTLVRKRAAAAPKKRARRPMDVHHSSDKDDWETDPRLMAALRREGFQFALDVAASATNRLAPRYYDAAVDALSLPEGRWAEDAAGGPIWMNPPYGRKVIGFVQRAAREALLGATVVALLASRTDTILFQQTVTPVAAVRLMLGRLTFQYQGAPILDGEGKPAPAPFPSLLAVFSPRVRPSIRCWDWRR